MKIGYCRVSTQEQCLDAQLDALRQAKVDKIYQDKCSGKNLDRPEYTKMIEHLRKGDTVVVYKMDRISRSLKDLINILGDFESKGVDFISLKESIDTSSSTGKLIFHIFGALSEFERDVIRERTKAGLQAARARGRVGGRPKKDIDVRKLRRLYKERKVEIRDLCVMFGISRASLYRYVAE